MSGNQMVTEYSVLPTGCDIDSPDALYFVIRIVYRGKGLWAVKNTGSVLSNITGKWDYEPQPSSRDKAFIDEFRWDLDEALAQVHLIINDHKINGNTFAELEAKHAARAADISSKDTK